MLLARAPFRISFAGGGTDLPAYYERYGGLVVSTTIDKYVYVQVASSTRGFGTQITSADYQTFYRLHTGDPITWDGDLALPRAVLHELDAPAEASIFVASEVPPGTGLGSSSAVAVALVAGVSTWLGRRLTRRDVAEIACTVELDKLQAPIGRQDQYASAFGGMNAISFTRDGVTVQPIQISAETQSLLAGRLMLFFTGTARNSAAILEEQRRASAAPSGRTVENLHEIRAMADQCHERLERGDLDGVGELLDAGWRKKRELASGITNPRIDEAYRVAQLHGAIGGKVAGAGGGGFLLIYCHEEHRASVTHAMEQLGLRRMDFGLDTHGATVGRVDWPGSASAARPNDPSALAAEPVSPSFDLEDQS